MTILVVDDERAVRESLRRALELEGYGVELAEDGEEALRGSPREPAPDAVDPGHPHAGRRRARGLPPAARDRQRGPRPHAHGARPRSTAAWPGLDAGADDYLPEALRPRRAARAAARAAPPRRRRRRPTATRLRFADLELDPGTREVRRDGDAIELTRTEFSLLELFLRNPRQVLTRSVIFERVWGYDFGPTSNSLDVYIGYLRRKTEVGGKPRLIHTVRGVGYALRES